MDKRYRVIFVCPHWKAPGNVGHLRAKRMVGWLASAGYFVSVIRAGNSSRVTKAPSFGEVITVRDPLNIWGDFADDQHLTQLDESGVATDRKSSSVGIPFQQKQRNPSSLRRTIAYHMFLPDLTRPWAELVCRNQHVLNASGKALWFLSSSPPESAHLAAKRLAMAMHGNFVMDMRDGWLDEPMKELLRTSRIHRWREKRLEKRCLEVADSIVVTSASWKKMLIKRYPQVTGKTHVILNAVPADELIESIDTFIKKELRTDSELEKMSPIKLLHAGRFSSSRPERNIDDLLNPIFEYISTEKRRSICVSLMGDLDFNEEDQISTWKQRFDTLGVEFLRTPFLPHKKALIEFAQADLLLLLSASNSSIPAKFYDYLATGKPILAAALPDSAVWDLGTDIPQVYLMDISNPVEAVRTLQKTFNDIESGNVSFRIPRELKPEHQCNDFLELFRLPGEVN
jgi:glycosyltransferase involved in cell wall biosynthesis